MGNKSIIRLGDRIELKDGENHDQEGWAHRFFDIHGEPIGPSSLDAEDVGEKQRIPGYVNRMDLATGMRVVAHLNDCYNVRGTSPGFTHIYIASKHGNVVNVGLGDTQLDSLRRGLAGDVNSPFGGFLAFNSAIERDTAEFFGRMFIEGTLAPGYESGVVGLLTREENHKKRLLMEHGIVGLDDLRGKHGLRFIDGGVLAQEPQKLEFDIRTQACVVSGNQANRGGMSVDSLGDDVVDAAQLAINMGGMISSNTVLYALPQALVGIGNGVGNRYFAARNGRMAMEESLWNHSRNSRYTRRALAGTPFSVGDFVDVLADDFSLVVYSDAFFPHPDGFVEALGIDRVNSYFANGVLDYVVENAKGEREDRLMHLARANYGNNHGAYDGNLVAKAVVQPGLCLGDRDAMAISDRFRVPMIFMVSGTDYQRRKELLADGSEEARAEARKIEGMRRFSH
jgi:AICAR transformylase/IMP cyclohydrolase PurH